MMKSFFKKLAFVMALAMVVSAMAPAATAKAADAGLVRQESTTWEIIKTDELTVGDKQDYKFAGAPTNWKEIGLVWSSSKPEVATVDKVTGLVTTVAAGETVIAVKGEGYEASLVLTVKPVEVKEPIATKAIADNKVQLTFADTTVNAAALKNNLVLKYYVAENHGITLQLIKGITDVKGQPGVVEVELYTTMNDGDVYGFAYNGLEGKVNFKLGNVKTVIFTLVEVNGDKKTAVNGYQVELNEAVSYEFKPMVFNEEGCDITSVAMYADGAYVDYVISEGEDFWPVTDGIQFSGAAKATVTATYYAPNKDGEIVAVGNPWTTVVEAVKPTPWELPFDATPIYTIATAAPADWSKLVANTKFAVGDFGLSLFVSVTDNKGGEVREGFRFESTNDQILYVTDGGLLMPNEKGSVDVLVWYTDYTKENPKEALVAVVPVNIRDARTITTANVSVDQTVLSTEAVAGANVAKATVTFADSLGDKNSDVVKNTVPTIELTTTKFPEGITKDNAPTPVVNYIEDGKYEIVLTAEAGAALVGSSTSYSYKVKVGTLERTFSLTVKAPKDVVTSYKLIFGGDADLAVGTNNDVTKVLTASLVGLSNGVAKDTLAFADKYNSKTAATEAMVGKYYYQVTKNNKDVATDITATGLEIDLTTKETKTIKQVSSATDAALTIECVKDDAGVGTYTVTVWTVKKNTNNGTCYYSKVLTGSKTVVDNEVTASYVDKLAPTYDVADATDVTSTDILNAIMDCFKFKVGKVELDAKGDYADYVIDAEVNMVTGGSVCYVKKVTFYRNCGGTYVNCGTVTVNSTIEFK